MKSITILIVGLVLALAAISPAPVRAGETQTPAVSLTCTSGSATLTDRYDDALRSPAIHTKTILATSDASGNVTACAVPAIYGVLVGWEIVPSSGDAQPTTLFDITLVKASGADILGGRGTNVANTSYVEGWTSITDASGNVMPIPLGGGLTLTGSAIGAANSFTVRLYVRI